MEDEFKIWAELLQEKEARGRRRWNDAARDPGHIRAHFVQQGYYPFWWDVNSSNMFRKIMRANRHSCHTWCCAARKYWKRQKRRLERHTIKTKLNSHPPII